jgi:UDP-N-acetylglucosamine 4,6-dehydratase
LLCPPSVSLNEPKRVLITGITGTLGSALAKALLAKYEDIKILGISRDEQKQRNLPKDPRLKLKLCDIRDKASLYRATVNAAWEPYNVCYHLAALKCVDTLEENPYESYQTNIQGTQNVVDLCSDLKTKVVFTSTDKAVYPINVYGQSKAVAERLVQHASPYNVVCRYGNVLGSRGSFIPVLKKSLIEEKKAYITDVNMSRFWISLDRVVDFIMAAGLGDNCHTGGLHCMPDMRSASVLNLIAAVAKIAGVKDYHLEEIGMRPGEKIAEHLMTKYESPTGKDVCSSDLQFNMMQGELVDFLTEVGVVNS